MTTTDLPTQIAQLEEEVFNKQKELHELRRQMPPEEIVNYQFLGDENQPIYLSELFGDKDDLIIIHNMGAGCAYCTLWADGFNGVLPHLEDRAAFVVVSPDAPQAQQKFAASRGWNFKMVSAKESGFTKDLGYTWEQNGESYMMPGFSTLKRTPEGNIIRIAHQAFGPGDPYSGIWHLFALLRDGVNEWEPKFRYS
jgi:predicted dithiol-disulfide oxidoreductase (DUF899 family)